ncbi:MAG: tRNA-uridine aminocarboxypropyltransferase [Thiomicrorhabdus sp.]|nr:MAG: tRNA-uridine aminocarboxypropyltransferase [Thiomicrorhabdus sp.]
MSRIICPVCERASKVCLCQWIEIIDNSVELGILQHPTEVTQVKGSAKIALLSFKCCRMWVGEDVSKLPELMEWLKSEETIFLLYPGIENQLEVFESFTIPEVKESYSLEKFKVLILDGTWRKTHKMMMLNSSLRGLNRISLQPQRESTYEIRKQKNSMSLSTVEAIYETYSQLEGSTQKFKPLMTAFERMQTQQLAFRKRPTED